MSHQPPPVVIGVLGCSGGLGASTLTVALALTAARRGASALAVDADLTGGGLDVTACAEHLPGLRWGDLAQARGAIDGDALWRELPAVAGARILSAGPSGASQPGPSLLSGVLGSLRTEADLVVVDLPASGATEQSLGLCDAIVVLAGVTARHLADATAVVAQAMRHCPDLWLLVRHGARASELPEVLAAHLDLPLTGRWGQDHRLGADADRGRPPGERARSPLAVLCERVLLDVAWRGAATEGAPTAALFPRRRGVAS
jgi:secretion/DNA translocation related CpaE-like protein